jgi:hypothetical protein
VKLDITVAYEASITGSNPVRGTKFGGSMKSIPTSLKAGQHNLRGKKHRLMPCGCCVMQDFRDQEIEKQAKKAVVDMLKKVEYENI